MYFRRYPILPVKISCHPYPYTPPPAGGHDVICHAIQSRARPSVLKWAESSDSCADQHLNQQRQLGFMFNVILKLDP